MTRITTSDDDDLRQKYVYRDDGEPLSGEDVQRAEPSVSDETFFIDEDTSALDTRRTADDETGD
jgi:hypothetical protein